MKPKRRGVFCLETIWYESADQTSVRPMLEMLRDCFLEVPFIHRHAVTVDAFKYHVLEWLSLEAKDFPILYLGYHGEEDLLQLRPPRIEGGYDGDDLIDTQLSLLEVADILRGLGGCENRLIHFASCSTLGIDDLNPLVDITGASAISGYSKEIDWVESTAFELTYLQNLQYGGQQPLTPHVMQMVRNGSGKHWPLFGSKGEPFVELSRHLGFQLEVRK